ncbi:hypothetical protein JZ751_008720 [Albula glossodonta]|uniref:Uncharacterized protein n=1 Tax=Albula glossodonta TaxID=121402 RepID=A0A8T2P1F6_9TELE|nr:hypothetical protein JZ751_008720 [Albula glossodonta]
MSFTPSVQHRSRVRRRGQLGELRAETEDQEHPETIRSFRPGTKQVGQTWESVDEPGELFLGDGGPREVEGDGLPLDDAGQGLRADGRTPAQVYPRPQPLITAPVQGERESS